jgi:DNA-binding transcriptional MocR family regulator
MPLLTLEPGNGMPLVAQIVTRLRARIDDRTLRPGTRVPAIRRFAEAHSVSRFTVVEAYDRLVALGYLESRRGSGFYVAPRALELPGECPARLDRAGDAVWLVREMLCHDPQTLKPSAAWLPRHWLDEEGIQRGLRALARKPGRHLTDYGEPLGYSPLRAQLQLKLADLGIAAQTSQIVLTHGANQALDLVIRYLLRPGDAVLVDDPGYYILFGDLKLHGVQLVGVPRGVSGPDVQALEKLAAEYKPRAFFLQSVLHNPTGTGLSAHAAFRVLQLAREHDFIVVEDDAYGDFHPGPAQRLAAMDQLERVIYIGSFSKTLSSSLRVGFLAGRPDLAHDLADIKMLSSISTCELTERLVYQMLTEGHYRKYLERVQARLREACARTLRNLERCGMEIYAEPASGVFLWVRSRQRDDAAEITRLAASEKIILAPGNVFRPHLEPSPWLRLNVAQCEDPRLFRFFSRLR